MSLLVSRCSLIIAIPGSLKAVYKGDKASSYVVAAVSLNDFSQTLIMFSTRLCLCFVRMSACSKPTCELSPHNPEGLMLWAGLSQQKDGSVLKSLLALKHHLPVRCQIFLARW